ncbi:MAG: hypothetical protein WD535_01240 [Thermaerobacterales bacterium]
MTRASTRTLLVVLTVAMGTLLGCSLLQDPGKAPGNGETSGDTAEPGGEADNGQDTEPTDETTGNGQAPEEPVDRTFAMESVQAGDMVGDLKVLSVEPFEADAPDEIQPNIRVQFAGQMMVSGTYHYFDEGELYRDFVCFDPDDAGALAVPRAEELPDWSFFCFDNQEMAKDVFGPTGSSGAATVVIQDYDFSAYPSDMAYNLATLLEVTNKDGAGGR